MGGYVASPVKPIAFVPGDKVKLNGDDRWWTVRAVSENFVACVRQAPFKKKGEVVYTVLDWRNGVRGPCNLIGQGYGDGTYSETECQEMLAEFEEDDLEVSSRNWVRLGVYDIRRKK